MSLLPDPELSSPSKEAAAAVREQVVSFERCQNLNDLLPFDISGDGPFFRHCQPSAQVQCARQFSGEVDPLLLHCPHGASKIERAVDEISGGQRQIGELVVGDRDVASWHRCEQ